MVKMNYLNYGRISEIMNELKKAGSREETMGYLNEEAYSKVVQLQGELRKLIMGELVEVEGKSCKENHGSLNNRDASVYYPGKVHHLDGDTNNESFGNLAMVCPKCQAHILLSRFSPEDIWLLKARGLSNAEIGRLLEMSRERVRQLCKKYEEKRGAKLTSLLETDPDELVKKAEYIENRLMASGRLKRRIDRRTKKKRIIAELDRQKEANIKGAHSPEG
jgi:hypothetical protein